MVGRYSLMVIMVNFEMIIELNKWIVGGWLSLAQQDVVDSNFTE